MIAHTEILFPVLLIILLLVVEAGFRARQVSPEIDADRQSLFESARDGLGLLLSFLLGFSLPMALPHYEQRNQLVLDDANAIKTVEQRAESQPEPFRGRILRSLRSYVDARIDFSTQKDDAAILASVDTANKIQNDIWQQTALLVQQNPNVATPLFVQSVGALSDLVESRLVAYEKRKPMAIWWVLFLISALACFFVGFSIKQRVLPAMLVVPLTVAIVLSLLSELDNSRTGFVNVGQKSMLRLAADLKAETGGGQ